VLPFQWTPANGINTVMGVGPGTDSPGVSSPLHALPGNLSQGLLINIPAGQLEFGPNPLTPVTSVSGIYNTTLSVQVSYAGAQSGIQTIFNNATIDSGGLGGYLPQNLLPSTLSGFTNNDFLPPGTTISVYSSNGQTMLYTTTITQAEYNAQAGPQVTTTSNGFNTGIIPFLQGPIYYSYNSGTTFFDY
jgi:hypothetical protein